MALKPCLSCRQIKTISEYYKHPAMTDGHLGKCKECCKRDARNNRATNLDYYIEYDKQRAMLPHRVEARKRYINTKRGKQLSNAAKKRWRAKNGDRCAAHTILRNAVKYGKINKMPCEVCGSKIRIHGHHEDYSKPLDVKWLCSKHHTEIHKF